MAKKISITLIFFIVLLNFSCNTAEPPDNRNISLSFEDVSCTEAWIKLEIKNITLPAQLNLIVNDNIKSNFTISTNDTIIYVDSLSPNKTYEIHSIVNPSNQSEVKSNILNLTTLDTTSNDFTWQTFTFGDDKAGSSRLNDISIINDSFVWAVGAINISDTSRNGYSTYNIAYWDSKSWKLLQTHFYTICGQSDVGSYPANAILTINDTLIWIASNNSEISIWQKNRQNAIKCLPVSVSAMFLTENNFVYTVGSHGQIGLFSNNQWKKVESGTNYFLNDICGDDNGNVYACGILDSNSSGNILVGASDSQFKILANSRILSESQLFHPDLYGEIASVFVDNTNTLYAAGNLLFRYKFGKWDYVKSLPENFIGGNRNVYYRGFITKVRGKGANDLWIIGDRNTIRHFNGVTWEQIGMPYDPNSNIIWNSIDIKDNSIIIVGSSGGKAIIMMIKK